MRSVNLLKVAAAAETLRYRCTLARQGRRAAFGASALLPLRSFLASFQLLQLLLAEILKAEHHIARVLVGADKLVEFELDRCVSRFWVF